MKGEWRKTGPEGLATCAIGTFVLSIPFLLLFAFMLRLAYN